MNWLIKENNIMLLSTQKYPEVNQALTFEQKKAKKKKTGCLVNCKHE